MSAQTVVKHSVKKRLTRKTVPLALPARIFYIVCNKLWWSFCPSLI